LQERFARGIQPITKALHKHKRFLHSARDENGFAPRGPSAAAHACKAHTFESCPDKEVISFLQSQANARYVTAVCTGSTVLAAAGLLDGFHAATHWAYVPILEALGIKAVLQRVVTDRNRITAGGVTAGIDFGLTLLAQLRGDDVARRRQLSIEYDPQPPFNAGHPRTAEPRITKEVSEWLKPYLDDAKSMVQRVSENKT